MWWGWAVHYPAGIHKSGENSAWASSPFLPGAQPANAGAAQGRERSKGRELSVKGKELNLGQVSRLTSQEPQFLTLYNGYINGAIRQDLLQEAGTITRMDTQKSLQQAWCQSPLFIPMTLPAPPRQLAHSLTVYV